MNGDRDVIVFVELGDDVVVRADLVQAVVPDKRHPGRSQVMVAGRWVDCQLHPRKAQQIIFDTMVRAEMAEEGRCEPVAVDRIEESMVRAGPEQVHRAAIGSQD